jgi:hypothetical protein
MAAKWPAAPGAKSELPKDFDVAVFRDFSLSARSDSDLRTLDMARARHDVSRETYLGELIARRVLVTVDDAEEEMKRIDKEGESLPQLMPFGQQQPPPQEAEDDDPEADQQAQKPQPPVGKKEAPRQAVAS